MTTTNPLTPRQTEVMREICQGKIGKEIANEMGVSTRTVETHIQLAKRALGARNIVQAAVMFSKHNDKLRDGGPVTPGFK